MQWQRQWQSNSEFMKSFNFHFQIRIICTQEKLGHTRVQLAQQRRAQSWLEWNNSLNIRWDFLFVLLLDTRWYLIEYPVGLPFFSLLSFCFPPCSFACLNSNIVNWFIFFLGHSKQQQYPSFQKVNTLNPWRRMVICRWKCFCDLRMGKWSCVSRIWTCRYKHFDWLYHVLVKKFGGVIAIPPLPEKQVKLILDF